MNDILFNVLASIVVALVAAVCRYLIPYACQLLRESRLSWMAEIIEYAVRAYEQIEGAGTGEKKYLKVSQYAREAFEAAHITITDEQLRILIEAAVQAMNAELNPVQPEEISDEYMQ